MTRRWRPTPSIGRPNLGSAKHGVLVWGEGGCAKNGLTFPEFLTELASHGFVILADGPPVENAGRGGAPRRRRCATAVAHRRRAARRWPASATGRWCPAGARAGGGPGRGAGPGRGGAAMTDGSALIAAIDWIAKEGNDRSSRFYQKVDDGPHRGDGHVVRRTDVLRRIGRSARRHGRHLEQRPHSARREDLRPDCIRP